MRNTLSEKALIVGVVILFVGASVASGYQISSSPQPLSRGWLYVGGTGPGNYSTVQSAVENATNGDTVFVYNGTYNGSPVEYSPWLHIDKTINLISEGSVEFYCDDGICCPNMEAITISADKVNISGFTFFAGMGNNTMALYGSNISLNYLSFISSGVVQNNLKVFSSYNSIMNSYFFYEEFCGGIIDILGSHNYIYNNFLYNRNSEYNIRISGSFNTIERNTMLNIADGPSLQYAIEIFNSNNIIRENTISCPWAHNELGRNNTGILISDANNNLIYHNNFMENASAIDTGINFWDDGYPSGGNFWFAYSGKDMDGDGIGDIPYNISGGNNQDRYPLIWPTGWNQYIWVDDDYNASTPGWGYDHFSSIQDGIDAVDVGGTVYVYNGTYHGYLTIGKNYLTLKGENKYSTIIDADGYGQGVDGAGLLITDYCQYSLVTGFTLINATYQGIWIDSEPSGYGAGANYNIVSDCIVRDCYNSNGIGIAARRGGSHADYNTIENCIVYNIEGTGLYIYTGDGVGNAVGNKILNCTSYNNQIGVTLAGLGGNLHNNSVINCTIYNNSIYGISALNNVLTNEIYHNTLFNNNQNTYDETINTYWFDTINLEGNYYDDYTGVDANSDGIGDTPYNISGGYNQDLYPLMYPFEQYYILNISLDNHEVDEGTTFNVTVKTLAGTIAPYAQVLFDNQTYSTGPNGTTVITAPSVAEDTVYPIVALKPGYTSDNDTILVKDIPQELVKAFIFGRYANLTEESGYITIEGVNLWLILFNPFEIYHLIIQYGGPEKVTYLRDTAKVILLPQFILGFVEVAS